MKLYQLFFLTLFAYFIGSQGLYAVISENEIVKKAMMCSKEELPLRVRTAKSLDVGCIKIADVKNIHSSSGCFDGDYFKVVYNKESDALCFANWKEGITNEKLLRLIRATTVYTSLTRAKEYFDHHPLFSDKSRGEIYPIIVRIDQTSKYDSDRKYNFDVEEQNNALTIGPSSFDDQIQVDEQTTIDPWQKEIMFNQAKDIKIKGNLQRVGEILRQRNIKNIIMYPLYMDTAYNVIQELTYALSNEVYRKYFYNPQIHFFSIGFTQAFIELLPELIIQPGKLFKRKVRLDTAMFPEVSYHEYTHIVLGDNFHYAQFTILNESIAHYYALQISGFDSLLIDNNYDNKNFNTVKPNNKSKDIYSLDYEFQKSSIYSSFGITVLKEWETAIGKNLFEYILSNTIDSLNDPFGEITLEKFLSLIREYIMELRSKKNVSVILNWKKDSELFQQSIDSKYNINIKNQATGIDSFRKKRIYALNPMSPDFFIELANLLNLELINLGNFREL